MSYISIFIGIIVILIIIILLWSMKKPKPSVNKWPLEYISSSGPITIDSTLKHYRPYNSHNPSNYYGIFKIDTANSYKLTVSSPEYYEVCIYNYPKWDIVYSETNICEILLDSLCPGEYVIMIHSLCEVKGSLSKRINKNKNLPESRYHYNGNSSLYDEVSVMYTEIVNIQSNFDLTPCKEDYTSQPLIKWPLMKYTKEEVLKFNPKSDIAIVIVSKHPKVKGCENGTLLAQSDNLEAYQLPGNQIYTITQVHTNINIEDEVLPIYAYTFNFCV